MTDRAPTAAAVPSAAAAGSSATGGPAVALGPRLVLTVLAALAGWEVGDVVSSWLLVTVLAPGAPMAFDLSGDLQLGTLAGLLLRVAVCLGVAAPTALLLLRPVLGYRERDGEV